MGYVVRALLTERGGTFTAEFETRQEATKSAKELREQGFQVTVIGPDGAPINETEDE